MIIKLEITIRSISDFARNSKTWYCNGQYHRNDGPCKIYGDGTKTWTLLNTHVKHIDHLGHVLIYRKDLLELFKD